MLLTGLRERSLGLLEQLKKVINKQKINTKGKTDFFIIILLHFKDKTNIRLAVKADQANTDIIFRMLAILIDA